MTKRKAQASLEYLMVTAFVLVIITIIFALSLSSTDQNIKTRQITESLDKLTQTADLVYALGTGNIFYTEITWPYEVETLTVLHKCKTAAELAGCPGGESSAICTNISCIKYSALVLHSKMNSNDLVYPSKAKISLKSFCDPPNATVPFIATGVRYEIKATASDNGMVMLERYCG